MDQLPSTFNQELIQTHLSKTELVLETALQIMKDFAVFGIQIKYSGNPQTAYNELHQQLVSQIEQLISTSKSKLISVLYRIDLSESELKKGELELPNYTYTEAMAHQIIVRELKKVLSRKFYK